MRITLTDAGKRFNRDWIFRHLSYTFTSGNSYAITGPNGSGKSTLLQSIAGAIGISEGKARYEIVGVGAQTGGMATGKGLAKAGGFGGKRLPDAGRVVEAGGMAILGGTAEATEVSADEVYRYLSLAAPYLELIEEMSALEFLRFHGSFKAFLPGCDETDIIWQVGLGDAADKQIRYYSSGMKQRMKLAQAIFSDTPVLLLDEPCTNLDVDGITLYRELIIRYSRDRLVIVSSNDRQEYEFCDKFLTILDYK
jgi:ABC-2 type transport system ATP-binding protein